MGRVTFLTACILLSVSFILAAQVNQSEQGNQENTAQSQTQQQIQNEGGESATQVQREANSRPQNESACPENCTCSGLTTKCKIKGQREITIVARKEGNIIIQAEGENVSTNASLSYTPKEGKFYIFLKNNKTKSIKIFPDQIKEKLQKKLRQRNESYNITLDENGIYQVQTQKRAKLFFLFPVKEKVKIEIDSETGNIIKTKTSWWGFFAKDSKDKELLGSSCGTVTPGYNDECCQNKGYDFWNSEKAECEFVAEGQVQE